MENNPRHLPTLILLLVLTAMTALTALTHTNVVSTAIGGPGPLVAIILSLAMAKIVLLAFRFMDLRHAHLFWKSALLLLAGGFLTVLGLLAAG